MRAILLVFLGFAPLFAQDAGTIGIVGPNLLNCKIPLERPASATWNWNRTETPDNGGEYTWQVAVPVQISGFKTSARPVAGFVQSRTGIGV